MGYKPKKVNLNNIMSTNFKVLQLSLFNNNIFKDIDVEFYDKTDHPREPYTTLIIGPNGTGKSNLLRILILLFTELNDYKEKGRRIPKVQGKFYLKYIFNGNTYCYFNFDIDKKHESVNIITPQIICNNVPILLYSEIEIPITIIALSNTITDKFPTDTKFKNYVYLGVKSNANTARTTTFIRKTVDLLYNALKDETVYNNIGKGLKFLDYEKALYVSYTPRYKHIIFKEDLDDQTFERFFTHFWEYTKRDKDSRPWSYNVFKKIKKDEPNKIPKLVRLCRKLKKHFEFYEGSKSQFFEFDIFKHPYTQEELSLILDLYSLDLISYPTLLFKKKDAYFDIEQSSSGEYHFISGFIGLIAKMTDNSLIVIDEPENSLHPNWQMKYISFFKNVFKNFTSCHIIIASHSHLMVSDLANESSCIIGLKKGKTITAESIKSNTYGWSSEEILMTIFETPSNRNYYLSEQLTEVFKLIAEEPDKRNVEQIKQKISNLKKLDLTGLNKEDPLRDVISELFKSFEYA